ncbi:hypothetical protein [Paenibacillus sp. DYY-L-2]|uniref:hypothetical protein n=1 Tax=Paenibacillus sp. DYY-L-2 TaxID=3447013 RepID=UPI003F506346
MLSELYQTIDSPEKLGKDILLPDYSSNAMYISRSGEFFCYSGIYLKDNDKTSFNSWPYYLRGKHSTNHEKLIKGLFRIKNGCILLTGFVDHEFYSHSSYKQLKDYVISLPTVNTSYYGIEKELSGRSICEDPRHL